MSMNYWLKYLSWIILGIPVMLLFESHFVGWLPYWFPRGFSLRHPFWGILVMACISRYADVASTIVALQSKLLFEGAPLIGKRPDGITLINLVTKQAVFIVVGGTALYYLDYIVQARFILGLISIVSFSATISNLLLFMGGLYIESRISMREYRREHSPFYHGDYIIRQFEREFDSHFLQAIQVLATVAALPLSAVLMALACTSALAMFLIFIALYILFSSLGGLSP